MYCISANNPLGEGGTTLYPVKICWLNVRDFGSLLKELVFAMQGKVNSSTNDTMAYATAVFIIQNGVQPEVTGLLP